MHYLPKKNFSQGQVLLSILIAIAIFSILAHALFTLIASSFELVTFNKARITARHIAQQKIELIRNLPYGEVATIGGIPNGTLIPQTETVERNGLNFTINTSIIYIDDPYDGTQGGIPDDTSPEDYKRVRIEVSWDGLAASRKNPIILISDVSALATGNLEGGTLVILVFDANGNPVPQVQVTIFSDSVSPVVNLSQTTDSNGRIILPGATECIECYQITVTKSGMSTDRTYSVSEVANPLKPHASIFVDKVTQISFAIDILGTLNIASHDSRENNFTPLGNIPFRLRGNKIIGSDTLAQPVYKFDQTLTTDGTGNLSLSNMEWDVYQFLMPTTTSYDFSGTSPLLPLSLAPSATVDFIFSVSPHTDHSFFLTIKNPTQSLIASASAHLTGPEGYDQTKETGLSGNPDFGQVLFSGLTFDTYNLVATASGYSDYSSTYDISGYTKTEVVLTPQ